MPMTADGDLLLLPCPTECGALLKPQLPRMSPRCSPHWGTDKTLSAPLLPSYTEGLVQLLGFRVAVEGKGPYQATGKHKRRRKRDQEGQRELPGLSCKIRGQTPAKLQQVHLCLQRQFDEGAGTLSPPVQHKHPGVIMPILLLHPAGHRPFLEALSSRKSLVLPL